MARAHARWIFANRSSRDQGYYVVVRSGYGDDKDKDLCATLESLRTINGHGPWVRQAACTLVVRMRYVH